MTTPLNVGVSNVDRSALGTRYTITRESLLPGTRVVAGYVEVTGSLWNVRDADNEPVRVGSAKYERLTAAVEHYQSWEERHQS